MDEASKQLVELAGKGTLDEFEEAHQLLEFIRRADREYSLGVECLTMVIRSLRAGETINDAIWYAQCEWDLG